MRKILSSAIALSIRRTPIINQRIGTRLGVCLISLPMVRYGFKVKFNIYITRH